MQKEIDGFLLVDKPSGITSAKLTAWVKSILGAKKAGHTGTLDPFATGIMLLCLGKATKLAKFFLHGTKTYEALLKLGVETDTQDLTGAVVNVCDSINISQKTLMEAFENYKGTILQNPPVFSALKHHGVPLYKLARMGKPVQKPARAVQIYDLEVLDIQLPEVKFRVSCSAGTYIRTLVTDIGKTLGCGGHLKALRRTALADFRIEDAVSPEKLKKAFPSGVSDSPQGLNQYLIPMTDALKFMPEYMVEEKTAKDIVHGRQISYKILVAGTIDPEKHSGGNLNPRQPREKYVKVVNTQGKLLAVLNLDKNRETCQYCCVFPD